MADLYSIIQGLQPDGQDILNAELFARQILETQYPDLDLREGTAARDLVLRPSAMLYALCKKGIDNYLAQNTLAGIDDNTDQALVDHLLGNLFLTRKTGSYAVINARLFFARQVTVAIPSSASFSTDGSLLFFPATALSYPSTTLTYDAYSNEYYIDVDLVAESKGISYNIASGSLLYFSNFNPYFLRGEINYLVSASIDPETNTEFITRASTAISTRNLINRPSIEANLLAKFPSMTSVYSVGAGDDAMYRDLSLIDGGTAPTFTPTYANWVNGGTEIQIGRIGHSAWVGQKYDFASADGSVAIIGAQVSAVVTANAFTVRVPLKASWNGSSRSFVLEDGNTIPQWSTLAPLPTLTATPHYGQIYAHLGGMVDVYVDRAPDSKLIQVTLDANGSCQVTGPVYDLVRSQLTGGIADDTVPYSAPFTVTKGGLSTYSGTATGPVAGDVTLEWRNCPLVAGMAVNVSGFPTAGQAFLWRVKSVSDTQVIFGDVLLPASSTGPCTVQFQAPSSETGFSARQVLSLSFGSGQANKTASFSVKKFPLVESTQAYLDSSDVRVLSADLLARGYNLYVLDFNLRSHAVPTPTSGEVALGVQSYLDSLVPGQEFILSDCASSLATKGVTGLALPLEVTAKYFGHEVWGAITIGVVDKLVPFSPNCAFILGEIAINAADSAPAEVQLYLSSLDGDLA